jgi:antitoxin ChpS
MHITDLTKIDEPGKPRFTVEELLAQCEPDAAISEEDRKWLDVPPAGREL